MLARRQVPKTGAAAGAALGLPWGIRQAYPFAQSPSNIRKFGSSCRAWDPQAPIKSGQYIPLATKTTTTFAGRFTEVYQPWVARAVWRKK